MFPKGSVASLGHYWEVVELQEMGALEGNKVTECTLERVIGRVCVCVCVCVCVSVSLSPKP